MWIWTLSNLCSQIVLFAAARDYHDGCERRTNYNYNFATVIVIIILWLWQYMVWILDICWPCIKAIYNIGTEILYFQCLNCLQTRLFCKSIIPEDSGITRRALSNASVKTRFKAILKIKDAWFCIPVLRFYVLTLLLQNNTTPKNTQQLRFSKFDLRLNLENDNSSFAPASRKLIKRLNQMRKQKYALKKS